MPKHYLIPSRSGGPDHAVTVSGHVVRCTTCKAAEYGRDCHAVRQVRDAEHRRGELVRAEAHDPFDRFDVPLGEGGGDPREGPMAP